MAGTRRFVAPVPLALFAVRCRDMRFADYEFTSVWTISAPRDRTWAYLESPEQGWSDWWPGLRSVRLERADGLLGSSASCRWRSPWGYVVTVDLVVIGLDPARQVELRAEGDLRGRGSVRFADTSDGRTRVTTLWRVTVMPRWMRAVAPVLRPVFVLGHHVVMRGGERGLERAIWATSLDGATTW